MKILAITATLLAAILLHGCAGTSMSGADVPAHEAPSRTVAMQCGTLPVTFHERDGRAQLETPEGSYSLARIASPAAARYQAVEHPDTEFRISGDRAQLTLGGETLPECLVPGRVAQPFSARGNEPFWRLDLDGDTLHLDRLGHDALSGRFGWDETTADVSRGSAMLADEGLVLRVRHEICHDSMTGMPHPRDVTLAWQGEEYSGCGGDPVRLLRGRAWVVDAMAGQQAFATAPPTLMFLAEGRVAGRAACNRYRATYELTGEGLTIDRPAVTRMACAAEVMEQEDRFLDHLAAVERFRIAGDGSLELVGAGETLVRLRHDR